MNPINQTDFVKELHSLLDVIDDYDVFLFDQWGVIHYGDYVSNRVNALFKELMLRKKSIIIISNSGKNAEANRHRLISMGLDKSFNLEIVTSGDVANWALNHSHPKLFSFLYETSILSLDESSPIDQLKPFIQEYKGMILWGLNEAVTEEEYLSFFYQSSRYKLPLLCVNPDLQRFTPNGIVASTGYYAQYYQSLAGSVVFIGKPDSLIYEYTFKKFFLKDKSKILMVGDSIHHDTLGASLVGIDCCLISSGIHREQFLKLGKDNLFKLWQKDGLFLPKYLLEKL